MLITANGKGENPDKHFGRYSTAENNGTCLIEHCCPKKSNVSAFKALCFYLHSLLILYRGQNKNTCHPILQTESLSCGAVPKENSGHAENQIEEGLKSL